MAIKVANAPVSWGIYEFEDVEPKFPYSRVLDEIAEIGYRGTELGPYGYFPTDPAAQRHELERRDLQLVSAFVPVELVARSAHEAGAEEAIEVATLLAALGAEYIILADENGAVPELVAQAGQRTGSLLCADEWDVFAEGVNAIARRVHDETGLGTVFHHHCAGYVETPEEVRQLMGRTDSDLVGLCLDTGHWHYGGGDAVSGLREYGDRMRHLHLKDCHPEVATRCREQGNDYFQAVAADVFCLLGSGEVDFPVILEILEKFGYGGWGTVEQDVLVDDLNAPKDYAIRNAAYLRRIGLWSADD